MHPSRPPSLPGLGVPIMGYFIHEVPLGLRNSCLEVLMAEAVSLQDQHISVARGPFPFLSCL